MRNSTSFATEVSLALNTMLNAITTEDPAERKRLLRSTDRNLGRAMNEAEIPDESGLVAKLAQHLDDMRGCEG